MKFQVQLVSRIPVFADLEIEADSNEEAIAKAEAMRDDSYHGLLYLPWEHGEVVQTKLPFKLDERDLDNIEVQDAFPA